MLATSRASDAVRPAVLARRAGAAPRAVASAAAARPFVSIRSATATDSLIPKRKIAAVQGLRPAAAPVAARRAVVAQAVSDPLER